jgi:hypothetical protein
MGKWKELNLAFNGVYRPNVDAFNPLEASEQYYSMEGWKIQKNVLRLTEGEEACLTYQANKVAEQVCWLQDHGTTSKYYYIDENELWQVTSTAEAQVTPTLWGSHPTLRSSSTLFRNRFLIADPTQGLVWLNPTTNDWRAVGITAPAASPTVAAGTSGVLTGRYRYVVTFVDDQGHESNTYGSNYAEITVTESKVNLSAIPTGGTGVSYRRIYRTIAQGEAFYYLAQINDNTTTTYTGDNAEDGSLGSPLQYDNTNPVLTISQIFSTGNRVYLVDGSDGRTLWISKIDPFTATPDWQHYPSDLSIKLPFDITDNPFQAGWELNSYIYVASRHSIHRILGDPGTGIAVKKVLDEGLFGRFSFVLLGDKVAYVDENKHLKLWDGDTEPKDIGVNVQDFLNDMVVDSGFNNVSLVYDAAENAVQVYYKKSSGYGSVRVDLGTGAAWDSATALQIPLYVIPASQIIGTRASDTTVYGESGYKYGGTRRTTQTIETHAIVPNPGKTTYFGRIKIEARALPIVSYVPPTLKVEWAANDSPTFTSKYVDLTKDDMVSSSPNVPVRKVVYVPIYRNAESIQIKLSSVNNSASLDNCVEIFRISIEAEDEQSKSDRRDWRADKGA